MALPPKTKENFVKLVTLPLILAPLCAFAVGKTTPPAGGKLTLAEAESIALRHAPQISAAYFRAQAANQVIAQARSAYLPQVSAEFSGVGTGNDIQNTLGGDDHVAGRDTRIGASGGLNNPLILSRQSDGVLISQLITDFGRTANLTSAARFHAKSEKERAKLAREIALYEVDKAYIGELEAEALYKVAKGTVDTRETVLDQVTALVNSNLKSQLDLSFAQVSVGEAKLLVVEAEKAMKETEAQLSAALGYSEPQHFTLVDDPQPSEPGATLDELCQQALQYRPEVIAMRADFEASKRFASAQRAAMFPKVSALGAMGRSPLGDPRVEGNYSAAGVNVELPVFTGGRLSAQYREAEYRAKEAQKVLQAEEEAVVRDVNIAWFDFIAGNQKIAVSGQLSASADEALKLAQSKFQLGATSIVELSQAQLSATQAEIAYASAKYEQEIQFVKLQFETGALKFRTPLPDVH
jgi:outer membrane protein